MSDPNFYVLFSLLAGTVQLSGYIYLLDLQIQEVKRPRSWITRYRWIVLAILATSVTTMVPSLFYLYFRMIGNDIEWLRNYVTITSRLSAIANLVLLLIFYKSKAESEEE